ncbi:hypothetical protein [Candidatus Odyssella thessalonicensis]|nr:hypothetical protein [Candidatus Odyssella thessalonicensis]
MLVDIIVNDIISNISAFGDPDDMIMVERMRTLGVTRDHSKVGGHAAKVK